MNPAPGWESAAAAAVALAALARALRLVTWSGAAAGVGVGVSAAAGFAAAGLLVLGAFFVVGSAATRIAYEKKRGLGTAEARGGARDCRNVIGKGGVAAALALAACFGLPTAVAYCGAVAAALGDTLGTECGSTSPGRPRAVPSFRSVAHGTPGAVSLVGLLSTIAGGAVVHGALALAAATGLSAPRGITEFPGWTLWAAAFAGPFAESLLVGLVPAAARVPGWVRNLVPTAVGAAAAHLLAGPRG